MSNIAFTCSDKERSFSLLQLITVVLLLFFSLYSNSANSSTTTLSATTPTNAGDFTLSWTATGTWYGANIYENDVKIGGATTPSYTLSGKANGSYNYYVETCYMGCTRSNTVTVVVENGTILSASTPTNAGDFTLSWTATETWYGANIYENDVKIGGATTPSYTLSGKANGSYNYYVDTCYMSCTRSNTVTVEVENLVVLEYTYDALGRLTYIKDTTKNDREYKYDAAGNRTTMENY